ncbi:MAG: MoaD/ThiS family protein [Nitrospirota bacterium]
MQVELRFLAGMRKLLPEKDRAHGSCRVQIEECATCAGVLDAAGVKAEGTLVVLLNGRYAEPSAKLRHGDVISVFPPVGGG